MVSPQAPIWRVQGFLPSWKFVHWPSFVCKILQFALRYTSLFAVYWLRDLFTLSYLSNMSSLEASWNKDRRITLSDWFRKRKETLRDKCARYGLSVIGKKPVLAERIYMYLHGETAPDENLSRVEEPAKSPAAVAQQPYNIHNEGFSLLSTATSSSQSPLVYSSVASNSKQAAPSQSAHSTSHLQSTASTAPLLATSISTSFQIPYVELRQLIREEFRRQQQQSTPDSAATQQAGSAPQQLFSAPQQTITTSLQGQLSPASSLSPESAPALPAHTTNLVMPITTPSVSVPVQAAPPIQQQQQQQPVRGASVGKNYFVLAEPPSSTLPPLSDKAVKAMQNYDYIDLSTLLPNSLYENPTNDSIVQLFATEENLFSATQSVSSSLKKPKITTVAEWLEAWNIYIRGMVHFHPSLAPSMLAYQESICTLQRSYPFTSWYRYDVAFRLNIARSKSTNWDQFYDYAFNRFIRSAPTMQPKPIKCFKCLKEGHYANACPNDNFRRQNAPPQQPKEDRSFSNPYHLHCRAFNSFGKCQDQECFRPHLCNRCNGPHPGSMCRKAKNQF